MTITHLHKIKHIHILSTPSPHMGHEIQQKCTQYGPEKMHTYLMFDNSITALPVSALNIFGWTMGRPSFL